jgi:hypothetical protein
MIRFWELTRCAGVDEENKPFPGMVVPLPGSNIVVLDTDGKELQVGTHHKGIQIEEFDATDLRKKLIETNIALSQPGVDRQYKEAMMPTSMFWYTKPRFFRIHGRKHPIDFPGALVEAKAGRKVEAALRVVVLDTMTIKIAIRNVKVRNAQGTPVFHATMPVDDVAECSAMNAVWIPQTNMVFQLIRSEPAFIDDRDKDTKATLAKGFGLKDANTAVFPPEVDAHKMQDVFRKHMVEGAHLTFFVVDKLHGGANGTTLPAGMAFVKSNHGATTFAHEAGHYLGGRLVNGAWDDLKDTERPIKMLMRDGGAGWKIPFDLAERFRGFFERHPVH